MTKVKKYKNERKMRNDIKKMERKGFRVLSVNQEAPRYGAFKTIFLGLIFLPMALLGKKKGQWVVVYQK